MDGEELTGHPAKECPEHLRTADDRCCRRSDPPHQMIRRQRLPETEPVHVVHLQCEPGIGTKTLKTPNPIVVSNRRLRK